VFLLPTSVVKVVNDSTGVATKGSISQRRASHIVLEGGTASKVQFVDEIQATNSECPFICVYPNVLPCISGITLSSDRNTHKSVNYESKYVTLQVPNYATLLQIDENN
jgi:hypothetical protein